VKWSSGKYLQSFFTHADSITKIPRERRGRSIQLKSHVSINGATLMTLESLYVAGARNPLRDALKLNVTEGLVKAASSESSRGSPIPSKTDARLLRSAGRIESSWDSRYTAAKADLSITTIYASTAIRIIHQLRRNTNINGDVLRGRSQT
jgi:hypothetical protein